MSIGEPLKVRDQTTEERRLLSLRALVQMSGADPSSVLDALYNVVRNRDWQRMPEGPMTFREYIRAADWTEDDLYNFVHHNKHRGENRRSPRYDPLVVNEMMELRTAVTKFLHRLDTPGPPKGQTNNPHGRAGKPEPDEGEETNTDNIKVSSSASYGTSPTYNIRRLRRDADPECNRDEADRDRKAAVLAKLDAGLISPNKAAVEAGYRPKMIQVPADPERAARILTRHFTRDQFNELVSAALDLYGVPSAGE